MLLLVESDQALYVLNHSTCTWLSHQALYVVVGASLVCGVGPEPCTSKEGAQRITVDHLQDLKYSKIKNLIAKIKNRRGVGQNYFKRVREMNRILAWV